MDGSESLPDGWVKLKSKSRPDKVYFHNKKLKLSVWSIEEVKKIQKSQFKITAKNSPTKHPPKTQIPSISEHSKVIKKNGAKERMEKVQKSLRDEVKRGNELKKVAPVISLAKKSSSILPPKPKSNKESKTNPNADKKNIAAMRLKKLNQQLMRDEKVKEENKIKVPVKIEEDSVKPENDVEMMDVSFENPSEELSEYEPMEWDEIPEEEILEKVQKIRTIKFSSVEMISCDFESFEHEFYVVVDTNVLLSNVDFVKDIKGKIFKDIGKATIFLPYIVLCELDRLKTHNDNVAKLARRAINFIDECFKLKDKFFKGQSAVDTFEKQKIPIESGDDEILNCCLNLQDTTKKILLLSNDKNLRNKAFVCKIESMSRDMLNFTEFNVKNEIKFD